jgi:hypothetical protein
MTAEAIREANFNMEDRANAAKNASPEMITPSKMLYEKVHRQDKVDNAKSPSEIQVRG